MMTQHLLLPSTQPVTDSLEDSSPPVDYENPWGRFHPMRMNLGHCINLIQNSFTVGRFAGCDYTLTKEEVGEKLYDCISNYQFRVDRKEEQEGLFVTFITDLSSNGTYLNGKHIGRNQTSILSHNDNIAVAKSTNNIFTFVDLSIQSSPYPDEIAKNYAVFNVLGKGGYGEVRLVMKKQTIEKFALKSIVLSPIEEKNVIDVWAEVKLLRQLNHDHIVKMYNFFLISEEDSMYILLEYLPGGDLAAYIRDRKVLSENVTKFIFYQILLGVEYLHSNKILHRDLKPANILLSSKSDYPKVKITDFGLSKILMNGREAAVHTRCGTLSFAPPELQFPNVSRTYDYRADVWSLGVILYLCLSGVLPFRRDRKDLPLEKQINTASYSMDMDIWKKVSNPPKFIIRKCLQRNPKNRTMVDRIIDDDWFRKDEQFQTRLLDLSQDHNIGDKENNNEPPLKKRCL